MDSTTEVLFAEMPGQDGNLGIVTLNRPAALNAINIAMIRAMHTQLQQWASTKHIKAVVIRAVAGRAFCAGGDIKQTYEYCLTHDPAAEYFFSEEYKLNRLIFHYPKPYIALLDGITMGGGVGISIHGSHRVATDKLVFAMPETGIGFFPDVGGTYFLPRLPEQMGYYLGLTGARITSDDCVALGIVQQKVATESLEELVNVLASTPLGVDPKQTVTTIINQFKVAIQPAPLLKHQPVIKQCFSANAVNMEVIIEALEQSKDVFCHETARIITKKSPLSLQVTLRALRAGKQLDFDACMQQEYRLACQFIQGHDFIEGVRAVLIDKDQQPHWRPATLAAISPAQVDEYFAPYP